MISPALDVFILAGQSNMSGRAPFAGLPVFPNIGRVRVYRNSGVWTGGHEPIDSPEQAIYPVANDDATASPGAAFGDRWAGLRPGATVGLVPCARGASSIAQWAPSLSTDTLFGQMIARAEAATAVGTLRGLIWYQGESDTMGDEALCDAWPPAFREVVAAARTRLGRPDLPVVMTVLGPNPQRADMPHWNRLEAAQTFMALPTNCARVSANDLSGQINDPVHLDTPSVVTLGRRYAEAMNALV